MPIERRSIASLAPVTVSLLVLIGAVFLVEMALGGATKSAVLLRLGGMYPPLVSSEPWRLLSAALLHVGLLHLAMNALALWQLGALCEITFGSAVTLSLFVFTGITGSLGSMVIGPLLHMEPHLSAGASGALFGFEGALVAYFLRHRARLSERGASLLRQLATWAAVMMVISFTVPGIDWMGHLGGLAGGLAVGWALPARSAPAPLARVTAAAAAVLLLATMGAVAMQPTLG